MVIILRGERGNNLESRNRSGTKKLDRKDATKIDTDLFSFLVLTLYLCKNWKKRWQNKVKNIFVWYLRYFSHIIARASSLRYKKNLKPAPVEYSTQMYDNVDRQLLVIRKSDLYENFS